MPPLINGYIYLGNGTVTDLPHHLPLILHDDFCDPRNPTIICVFSNHCNVVAFVNNVCGCLRGDTANSPQHLLEMQLDKCMHGSIVVTLDPFFSQQKDWKEEIFSIPITHSGILWLSQCRPDKPGGMNVFKYTKMLFSQYRDMANQPRFHAVSNVTILNEFSIGFAH